MMESFSSESLKNSAEHDGQRANNDMKQKTGNADKADNQKRSDCLSWEDYFMSVALLSAKRSKDPVTQVGACIVNSQNKVVGIGYNGMPVGCYDDDMPWGKSSKNPLETKHPYVCHAEMNAITFRNLADISGCTMYVTLFPCNECAKIIMQAGIKKVYYLSYKSSDRNQSEASNRLFQKGNVECSQYVPKQKEVLLKLE